MAPTLTPCAARFLISLQFLVAARLGTANGLSEDREERDQMLQRVGWQDDDCYAPSGKILLMMNILVGSDKDLELVGLGSAQ